MNLTEPGCTQVKLTNLGQPGYSSRSSQQELGLAQAVLAQDLSLDYGSPESQQHLGRKGVLKS